MTVQGQDCRVDVATLHPKFVMTSMMRICLCGLASWRNNISDIFFWDELNEGEHSDFSQSVNIVVSSPLSPLAKKFTSTTTFSFQKSVTFIFPTDSSPFSQLMLGFGFKRQNQFPTHDNVQKVALTYTLIWVQKISGNNFHCLFVHLSAFRATNKLRLWNSYTLQ